MVPSDPDSPPVRRVAERFDTELPIEWNGQRGLTRNLSLTGVYFETEGAQQPGTRVHFSVELTVGGQTFTLPCEGEVIRVEHTPEGRLGIAARLSQPILDLDEPTELAAPNTSEPV